MLLGPITLFALSWLPITSTSAATLENTIELLDDWQLEDALLGASQLLSDNPDEPRNWVLAGLVQHQRGEHVSALHLLRAANNVGLADNSNVLELVENSANYAAHFATLETPHFKIRYLNKDEIVAVYAETVLEAAYKNIGADLEFLPAERGEKIAVEIFPDANGLSGATGLSVKDIETSGTIAVCKFHRLMITSPLATANGYDWADTIAHEFTHLIISKKSHNNVPIWLHEGIAKYYESRWKGPAGQALGPFSEKLLKEAVETKKFISYQQMHPSMAKLPSQESAALAFAEVFTTIEFLVERFGPRSIPKVLQTLAEGVPFDNALKEAFGLSLSEIEGQWKKYLSKRKFRDVAGAEPQKIRLAARESEAAAEKPLEKIIDKDSQNYSRLGELLQLRGNHRAAIIEYEKAYARSGVRYPTLNVRLARAYLQIARSQDAIALLEKTLAAHPDDADLRVLTGRTLMDKQEYAKAKQHFLAVTLINPFNPEIHAGLAAIYKSEKNTAEAERETRFYELSSKARPTRKYSLPQLPEAKASASLTTKNWTWLRIDAGTPVAAPAWSVPLNPGTHVVEFPQNSGQTKVVTFQLKDNEHKFLMLQ